LENLNIIQIFDLNVPIIQISLYPKSIREQKGYFVKAITNAIIEILKGQLCQQHMIRKSNYQSLTENWYYILGDHSSQERDSGISRMNKKGVEI